LWTRGAGACRRRGMRGCGSGRVCGAGLGLGEAVAAAGLNWPPQRWPAEAGGVKGNGPGPVSGRYLSLAEREEIAVGLAARKSLRQIARELGRPVSVDGEPEVDRNSSGAGSGIARR
jgi:Helix-turn-helix domain